MTYRPTKPPPGEYAPYYERYISLAPDHDIVEAIEQQRRDTILLLSCRDERDGDYRYAPDKWNLKEVVGDRKSVV